MLVPEQADKDTLGTRRLALGLFCPTGPTGVPRDPVLPQSCVLAMLLHANKLSAGIVMPDKLSMEEEI